MSDTNSIHIHETAFVTATYRATDEGLSKDPFARLWVNDKTDAWLEGYLEAVSRFDPFGHCLRNRFFYEAVKTLHAAGEIEVLINFGAGFSMYPHSLHASLAHIEIDMPDVISFKSGKIRAWQSDGTLPERDIHFLPADFNTIDHDALIDQINTLTRGRKSFVLIEGVLFFLSRHETDRLFGLINRIQGPGGYIGSVSYNESIEKVTAFKNLVTFFKDKVLLDDLFEYQVLPDSYYSNLKHYTLMDHQDYFSASERYAEKDIRPFRDEVLNENMYVLKKSLG